MSEFKVLLTLTEDILGTLPANEQIYKDYIASKSPNASTLTEEIDAITKNRATDSENAEQDAIDEIVEKGMTIFARDKDGNPCVYDYLIKGFFKNACKAMREVSDSKSKGFTAYKTKIDNLVFPKPRLIPINFDGEIGICERPLRASTAQGERVAIAVSESIPAGATLEFTIKTMDKKMDALVYEWLDYGEYNGLGQWHNSGKGRFSWKLIEEDINADKTA